MTLVNPNAPAGVNEKSATDMFTGKKEDLMTGNTTNATKPWLDVGNGVQVQNFGSGGIKAPMADLVGFISSNSSDYSWASTSIAQPPANPNAGMAWTSTGLVPIISGTGANSNPCISVTCIPQGRQGSGADYVSAQLGLYVINGTVSLNLHNGDVFGGFGVVRSYPSYSTKPGISVVAGSLIGGGGAQATSEFLGGAGSQGSYFFPAPFAPLLGLGGGLSHSHGGGDAVEVGISFPPGGAISPGGYSVPLNKGK